jgi:prevent-host-death family protein
MTVNVNIHEAKTHLSRLLERVANGERVIISKAGEPVADLIPHQRTPVVFGGLRGEVSYTDDSFAELDPDIQRLFYGDDVAAP